MQAAFNSLLQRGIDNHWYKKRGFACIASSAWNAASYMQL